MNWFCALLGSLFVSVCAPSDDFIVDVGDSISATAATEVAVKTEISHERELAPDIVAGLEWIGDVRYQSLEELRGQVVMIDFWTLGCINCQRALPHVGVLYGKYKDDGFVVIGVHAPEFAYERKKENIIGAIEKWDIQYPVVLDNDFEIWKNYNNRYWPAQFIIGRDGMLRYQHIGEGAYLEMDQIVNNLLQEKYESI